MPSTLFSARSNNTRRDHASICGSELVRPMGDLLLHTAIHTGQNFLVYLMTPHGAKLRIPSSPQSMDASFLFRRKMKLQVQFEEGHRALL